MSDWSEKQTTANTHDKNEWTASFLSNAQFAARLGINWCSIGTSNEWNVIGRKWWHGVFNCTIVFLWQRTSLCPPRLSRLSRRAQAYPGFYPLRGQSWKMPQGRIKIWSFTGLLGILDWASEIIYWKCLPEKDFHGISPALEAPSSNLMHEKMDLGLPTATGAPSAAKRSFGQLVSVGGVSLSNFRLHKTRGCVKISYRSPQGKCSIFGGGSLRSLLLRWW